MKKSFLLIAFSAVVLLFSCTEKMSLSTVGSGQVLIDTTYVEAVKAQQPRKVLAEEATGVRCPNCPDGAMRLKEIEEKYPGRLVVIGLHAGNLTDPLEESKYNFQTNFAAYLFSSYFGDPESKPAAVFNRIKQPDGTYFSYNRLGWEIIAGDQLKNSAPLNLSLTSVYNTETDDYFVTVKGAYTTEVNKLQNLSIMITEDSIIDAQDDEKGRVIEEYTHMHVLRDMLTSTTGDPILSNFTPIEKGRLFVKSFRYKIPEDKKEEWNADHLNIVAFVHNNEGGDKEVQQAEEIKLKNQ